MSRSRRPDPATTAHEERWFREGARSLLATSDAEAPAPIRIAALGIQAVIQAEIRAENADDQYAFLSFPRSFVLVDCFVRVAPDLTRSVGGRVAAVAPGPQPPAVAGGEAVVDQDAMDVDVDPASEEDAEGVEFELDEAVPVPGDGDVGEPAARRRRVTRKVTASIFFDRLKELNLYACKVGCLGNDTVSRKELKCHNTGHMVKHMSAAHPLLWNMFLGCKNNAASYNTLLANIDSAAKVVAAKIEKNKKSTLKWTRSFEAHVEGAVASNLLLLMWQIANGIGRMSSNCPIFDLYLRSLGTNPAANRHTFQESYLPLLSALVVEEQREELSECSSVSLSADGWRSRTRQDFMSVTAAWMKTVADGTWKIGVAEVDLIHVSGSTTAETLETLVSNSVEGFVRVLLEKNAITAHYSFTVLVASRLPHLHNDNRWRCQRASRRLSARRRRQ